MIPAGPVIQHVLLPEQQEIRCSVKLIDLHDGAEHEPGQRTMSVGRQRWTRLCGRYRILSAPRNSIADLVCASFFRMLGIGPGSPPH